MILSILLIAIFACNNVGFAGGGKLDKVHKQFMDKAEKLKKKGALAIVGVAVANAGRIDIGKRKAMEMAKVEMAENKEDYITKTVHNLMEELGVGKGSEDNDRFSQVVESTAKTILSGAEVVDFSYYITKANKADGTATYLVLYVVTPETFQKSLETELKAKGSKDNLYQRYIDSKAKEEHDKMIKEYDEMKKSMEK